MMRSSILLSTLTALSLCAGMTAPAAQVGDAVQPEGHGFSIVYQFSRHHGKSPVCGVLPLPDGALLGLTVYGGADKSGTIYRIAPDGTQAVVHAFGPSPGDGQWPFTCLLQASDGHIYGTTPGGGEFFGGIVFRIEPDGGGYTVLHAFDGSAGGPSTPSTSLVEATDANFYGASFHGGRGAGTIYRMTPAGDVTVLHVFTDNGHQGSAPSALMQATDGNLYGTMGTGGANGAGVFFRVRLDGTFKVLHDFEPVGEGADPRGAIVEGKDGSFYGTLAGNGPRGYGSVYRLKRDGALTVLHAFGSDPGEGAAPDGLMREPDGTFYGTTSSGGFGVGTLYKMNAEGKLTTLHQFENFAGGYYPEGGIALGSDGFIYGVCPSGGEHSRQVPSGWGTVFRIAPGRADQ